MSPSWRDRLLISLAPSELFWMRLSGRINPSVVAKGAMLADPGYGSHAWDGVIAVLRTQAATWSRDNLSVRIALSNHFVRYALVTPRTGVSGDEEELALARFQFGKVHGEISRGWDLRLSTAQTTGTRAACATDSALVQALRDTFPEKHRPRLTSVQPLLMSVFNSGRRLIPKSGAWLVLAEAERSCVALLKGKTWHAIQNVNGRFSDIPSWIALIERERWRVNLDIVPDTILVHATQASVLPNRVHGPWKIMGLQNRWPLGLQPTGDGAYVQALSAA